MRQPALLNCRLFIGAAIFLTTFVGLRATESLEGAYTRVIEPLRKTYAIEDEKPVQAINTPNKVDPRAALSAEKLSVAQQINILLDLAKPLPSFIENPITVDSTFINKMELWDLITRINRTNSNVGKIALASKLATPTADISMLLQRQEAIKALISNAETFKAINDNLIAIQQAEPHFLSFFKPLDPAAQTLIDQVYWGKWLNFLNNNSLALETRTRIGNLGSLFGFFALPAMIYCYCLSGIHNFTKMQTAQTLDDIKYYGNFLQTTEPFNRPSEKLEFSERLKNGETKLANLNRISLWDKAAFSGRLTKNILAFLLNPFKSTYRSVDEVPKTFPSFMSNLVTTDKEILNSPAAYKPINNSITWNGPRSLGDVFTIIDRQEAPAAKKTALKGMTLGTVGSLAAFQIFCSWKVYNSTKLTIETINYIHTKMIGVANYTRSIQHLATLIQQTPELANLKELQPIVELTTTKNSKVQKLLKLLSSSTFNGDTATIASLSGRVLAAHKLFEQVKDEFIPAIFAVGQLDAYMSIAHLMIEGTHNRVGYCFAEYISQAQSPYIALNDFWNPFVPVQTAICNTVEFGTAEKPNNAILTGPNTGGKTTTLKGILINLLMAQTFGIAAAKHFIFTPFSVLNCYLNITDDLSAGTSLFKAEVLRAKALLEGIKKLAPHEFSFTFMDEIFSGTSPQEGEQAALEFARSLGGFGNSVAVLATHYPRLTTLASKSSSFKNYKVSVYKNADGSWNRPFKVEEGISDINIALDLLKEEGVLFNA